MEEWWWRWSGVVWRVSGRLWQVWGCVWWSWVDIRVGGRWVVLWIGALVREGRVRCGVRVDGRME